MKKLQTYFLIALIVICCGTSGMTQEEPITNDAPSSVIHVSKGRNKTLPMLTIYMAEPDGYTSTQDVSEWPLYQKVKTFLDSKQVGYQIVQVDWEAGYVRTLNRPNTMFFPIDKTPQRKTQLHWFTALAHGEYFIYGLNNKDNEYLTREQLIKGDKTFSCQSFSSQCEWLREFGIKEHQIIENRQYSAKLRYAGLLRERSNFTILAPSNFKQLNLDEDKVLQMFKLKDVHSYLVSGLQIDQRLLDILYAQ